MYVGACVCMCVYDQYLNNSNTVRGHEIRYL